MSLPKRSKVTFLIKCYFTMLFFDGHAMMHLYASIIAKTYNGQVFDHRKCMANGGGGWSKVHKAYVRRGG